MIVDKNKRITAITYNHLNLPTKITFGTTGNIDYIYNAVGQKLQKSVFMASQGSIPSQTYYLNGFQYVFRENFVDYDTVLKFFPTSEGYVKNTAGVYAYVYNYTDHLGNIRLSYQDTDKNGTISSNEILEESNYYPFGLKHSGYNGNNAQANYKYKYNGKELQDELGLNMYDYGFRNYMPDIGRWTQIDPLAEKFISESPYAYVNNDPLGYSDFDGKDYTIDITRDKDGNITGVSISGTVYIQGNGASQKRADELNKFAKDNLKTKSVDGVSVSIGVNYKYDNEKKEKDLKQGENLLTFDSATEDNSNISHINAMEISQEGKKTKFLAGKTGTIYGSGQDNNTVFHESMHLLGLVDRYEDNRDKKWIPAELRGTIPDKGYEKNAMGNSSYTNLNQQQYRSWMEHAVSRSKANNNTNRIIGVLQVDRSIKTKK